MSRSTILHAADVAGRVVVALALSGAIFAVAVPLAIVWHEARHVDPSYAVEHLVGSIREAVLVAAVLGGALSGVVFALRATAATRRHCLWAYAAIAAATILWSGASGQMDGWSMLATVLPVAVAAAVRLPSRAAGVAQAS